MRAQCKDSPYVDDIAVVAPSPARLRDVMHRIDSLSQIVGFHSNREKTQIYKWAPQHHEETIAWFTDILQPTTPSVPVRGPCRGSP